MKLGMRDVSKWRFALLMGLNRLAVPHLHICKFRCFDFLVPHEKLASRLGDDWILTVVRVGP